MFFGGVIAGWCNENTSGGGIVLIVLFLVAHYLNHNKFKAWMWSGLLGSLVGFLILVKAPGNHVRAMSEINPNESFSHRFISAFTSITNNIQFDFTWLIIIFVFLIAIQWIIEKKWYVKYLSISYFISSLLVLYVLVLAPVEQGGRPFFGGAILMILACSQALNTLAPELVSEQWKKILSLAMILMLFIQFCLSYTTGIIDVYHTYKSIQIRNSYILQQRESGNRNIVVPPLYVPQTKYSPMFGLNDLIDNPSGFPNKIYPDYFNIDSIRVVDSETWNNVYQYGDPKLMAISNLDSYLEQLKNTNYFVYIAGYGSSKINLNSNEKQLFRSLGIILKTNINNWSYIGILSNGKSIFNQTSGQYIKKQFRDTLIESSISNFGDERFASIKLANAQFSRNGTGLSIVVFDKNLNRVVDSVSFDVTVPDSFGYR
jgi:hypothetical protein